MFYLKSSSHLPSLASSLLSPSQADISLVCPSLSLPAHKALLLHHLPSLLTLLCPSCSSHDPLVLLLPDTPAPALRSALQQLYVRADPGPLAALLEIRKESEIKTEFNVEKKKETATIKTFQCEPWLEERKETTKYSRGNTEHIDSSETKKNLVDKETRVDSVEFCGNSKCDVCEKSFESKALLDIHKRNNHICLSNNTKSSQNIVKEGVDNTVNHTSNERKGVLSDIISPEKSPERNVLLLEEPNNENSLVGSASPSFSMSSIIEENITKYITCDQCGRTDVAKSKLSQHMRRRHSSIRFTCPVCNTVVKEKDTLTSHMRLHDPNRPPPKVYTCETCGKSGMTHRMYKGHTRRNHADQYRVELATKVALIKAREQPNATTAGVAKHFNLGLSTVQLILRHKEKHLRNYSEARSF